MRRPCAPPHRGGPAGNRTRICTFVACHSCHYTTGPVVLRPRIERGAPDWQTGRLPLPQRSGSLGRNRTPAAVTRTQHPSTRRRDRWCPQPESNEHPRFTRPAHCHCAIGAKDRLPGLEPEPAWTPRAGNAVLSCDTPQTDYKGTGGVDPPTFTQSVTSVFARCSADLSYVPGGASEDRTHDLFVANEALYR